MNAKDVRERTNRVLFTNESFNEVYFKAMEIIWQAAEQGKCYVEFDKAVQTDLPNLRLHMRYILLSEGYRIVYKEELGGVWDCTDCICW